MAWNSKDESSPFSFVILKRDFSIFGNISWHPEHHTVIEESVLERQAHAIEVKLTAGTSFLAGVDFVLELKTW